MSWDDRVDEMTEDQFPLPSKRAFDWRDFSYKVEAHIEDYTVPQYGDKGSDQCTEFTVQDFQTQIKKYANRMGRNSRPGQDKLDLLKMAHYCQMLHDLIKE